MWDEQRRRSDCFGALESSLHRYDQKKQKLDESKIGQSEAKKYIRLLENFVNEVRSIINS